MEQTKKWYQKTWVIILLSLAVAILALAIGFGLLTFEYWKQIKGGNNEAIRNQFYKTDNTHDSLNIQNNRAKAEDIKDPYLGTTSSSVVIVEFVDFKCPYCKQVYPLVNKINSTYGKKVKIIIRDFPVESLHSGANLLAQFAYCAQSQNKFWQVYDYLFVNQDSLPATIDNDYLLSLGEKLRLDKSQLNNCLEANETVTEVNNDFNDGVYLGVEGTPTFFINGEKIEGTPTWDNWKNYLDSITNN